MLFIWHGHEQRPLFKNSLTECCDWPIRLVHSKMKNSVIIYLLSSSYKPVWISFFCWTQKKNMVKQKLDRPRWLPKYKTMEINGVHQLLSFQHSSKFIFCAQKERNEYRFGITWEWVNYDRIFIFGWTVP